MPGKKYHHGDLKNALIQAGIEILSKEGTSGLSLRKVAQRAGVSHSAPYAHFPDKQSLIAAISTEGFNQLYAALTTAITPFADNPRGQLDAGARAYTRFALEHTDTFKIMFSGVLEKEKEYPAFVEISKRTFEVLVDIVRACLAAGLLDSADAPLLAVAVWGQLHGVILLALEGQVPHTLLELHALEEIVAFAVGQMVAPRPVQDGE